MVEITFCIAFRMFLRIFEKIVLMLVKPCMNARIHRSPEHTTSHARSFLGQLTRYHEFENEICINCMCMFVFSSLKWIYNFSLKLYTFRGKQCSPCSYPRRLFAV